MTTLETCAAPDYTEPVVGWRTWLVEETTAGMRLRSMVFPERWEPRHELVASCRRRNLLRRLRGETHAAPRRRCECGVHAADLPTALYYLTASYWDGRCLARVIGRVSLWGTVVEHEAGWRATAAYPAELWVPCPGTGTEPAERVAFELLAYGVPVRLLDGSSAHELVRGLGASA